MRKIHKFSLHVSKPINTTILGLHVSILEINYVSASFLWIVILVLMNRVKLLITSFLCVALMGCGVGTVTPTHESAKHCQSLPKVQRTECFTLVALEEGNTDICDYIIEIGFRVVCKKEIAVNRCDESLCDQIQQKWKRQNCLDAVRGECK